MNLLTVEAVGPSESDIFNASQTITANFQVNKHEQLITFHKLLFIFLAPMRHCVGFELRSETQHVVS